VNCRDLVNANVERLPGLSSISRLMDSTRIQVSNLDIHHTKHKPYCHWTFPNAKFEEGEPSTMMARRHTRRKAAAARNGRGKYYCSARITKNSPNPFIEASGSPNSHMHPRKPVQPKKPLTSHALFLADMQDTANNITKKSTNDLLTSARDWESLDCFEQSRYEQKAEDLKNNYDKEMKRYRQKMKAFRHSKPDSRVANCLVNKTSNGGRNLFNQVVKLNEAGASELGNEYGYYYVLTYLPDLQWCHLAPMITNGCFGPDKPRAEGRPKWVLVDESEGKEVDTSASFCVLANAREMNKADDADDEEWDIVPDSNLSHTEMKSCTTPKNKLKLSLPAPASGENSYGICTDENKKTKRKLGDVFSECTFQGDKARKKMKTTQVKVKVNSAMLESKPVPLTFNSLKKGKSDIRQYMKC